MRGNRKEVAPVSCKHPLSGLGICPAGAKIGLSYRDVRETEGSRNRDSTVFMSLNLLFRLSTRNGATIKKNSQTFCR